MRAHMARGVCAESDDFEGTSHDLLSRATSVALKATDAIKEAADELQNWNDQQHRSGGAGVRVRLQKGGLRCLNASRLTELYVPRPYA